MKRLKLKSRELKKCGYPEGPVTSVAMNVMEKNFKHMKKEEAISLLKDILKNPQEYEHHEILGKIVRAMYPKQKTKKERQIKTGSGKQIELIQEKRSYEVFGPDLIEGEAFQQMDFAMQLPVTVSGALMADAHAGYGLPIGGVLATENAVIPYGVGMDIGCRMSLSVFDIPAGYINKKRDLIKKILIENTRFGRDEFKDLKQHQVLERKEFKEIKLLKTLHRKAYDQLGTSGSGNHFVDVGSMLFTSGNEFGIQPGDYLAVLTHSGSRNLGAEIARHYTKLAKNMRQLPKGAVNLAWLGLEEEEGQEYWKAMNLAGDYSAANHQLIHEKIASAFRENALLRIENHHNFAWKEQLNDGHTVIVHRKGATPAQKGVLGIIPGSMATPAYLVKGLGCSKSLNSASHGAGRLMSRSKAKSHFTKNVVKDTLIKAGVELMSGGLDEAPGAYKNIVKIMQSQEELVETLAVFHPKIVRMNAG